MKHLQIINNQIERIKFDEPQPLRLDCGRLVFAQSVSRRGGIVVYVFTMRANYEVVILTGATANRIFADAMFKRMQQLKRRAGVAL